MSSKLILHPVLKGRPWESTPIKSGSCAMRPDYDDLLDAVFEEEKEEGSNAIAAVAKPNLETGILLEFTTFTLALLPDGTWKIAEQNR